MTFLPSYFECAQQQHETFCEDKTFTVAMEGESSNGLDGPSSSDIGRFVSLTNVPEQQAAFFLEATNGNFDRAIEMFYGRRFLIISFYS